MEDDPAAVPWDFGPPTGRGMRATRDLKKGDVVLRTPIAELVTPRRCRALLLKLAELSLAGGSYAKMTRLQSLDDVKMGFGVQVLEDSDEVFAACRAVGIGTDNDDARRRLLGKVVLVKDIDESDSTVELEIPREPNTDAVWLAVTALARPSLDKAIAAIPDEIILVMAVLVARSWRADPSCRGEVEAAEQEFCPGLASMLSELPEEVGLVAEWSDEELRGLEGSLHAASARRARNDVQEARALARFILAGSAPALDKLTFLEKERSFPSLWGTESSFMWAWVRVASRHRDTKALPSVRAAQEGKTIMIPGGSDFFNHSTRVIGQCLWESSDGCFVEIRALDDCVQGDEVFISYGTKPNSELLLGYGFTISDNPYDRVELVLGLDQLNLQQRGGLRADLYMECLQAASMHTDDGATLDCELLPATKDSSEPQVRIALSLRDPLPAGLLSLTRLERLSDSELTSLDAGVGRAELRACLRAGRSLEPRNDDMNIELACVAMRAELRSLGSLRRLFDSMLSAYPASNSPSIATDTLGTAAASRAACCSELCNAEKAILRRALQKVDGLLAKAVRVSLGMARLLGTAASGGTGGYVADTGSALNQATCTVQKHLAARQVMVDAHANVTAKLFHELGARPPGPPSVAAAVWTQTCSFFFFMLHGTLSHPLVDVTVPYLEEYWFKRSTGAISEGASDNSVIPVETRALQRWGTLTEPADACDGNLLALFQAKTAMWGRYLFAQFLVSGAVSLQAMKDMAMESVDIRKRNAWSVPTQEALELLAAESPLVEIGCGLGLWAAQLRARGGVEIRAFDLGTWDPAFSSTSDDAAAVTGDGLDEMSVTKRFCEVEQGGPEALEGLGKTHRALVLMWPDYNGEGSFGLDCVRRWALEERGERLVCVGEWKGTNTLGAFAPGRPAHGQSFSLNCQRFVEDHFRLSQHLQLPNWPLFLDGVRVYERQH